MESKRGSEKKNEEIHPHTGELPHEILKLRTGYLTSKEQNSKEISLRDPTRRVRNKQLC